MKSDVTYYEKRYTWSCFFFSWKKVFIKSTISIISHWVFFLCSSHYLFSCRSLHRVFVIPFSDLIYLSFLSNQCIRPFTSLFCYLCCSINSLFISVLNFSTNTVQVSSVFLKKYPLIDDLYFFIFNTSFLSF